MWEVRAENVLMIKWSVPWRKELTSYICFALVFRFGNLSLILWLKGSKFLEIQRQDLGKFAALWFIIVLKPGDIAHRTFDFILPECSFCESSFLYHQRYSDSLSVELTPFWPSEDLSRFLQNLSIILIKMKGYRFVSISSCLW